MHPFWMAGIAAHKKQTATAFTTDAVQDIYYLPDEVYTVSTINYGVQTVYEIQNKLGMYTPVDVWQGIILLPERSG